MQCSLDGQTSYTPWICRVDQLDEQVVEPGYAGRPAGQTGYGSWICRVDQLDMQVVGPGYTMYAVKLLIDSIIWIENSAYLFTGFTL